MNLITPQIQFGLWFGVITAAAIIFPAISDGQGSSFLSSFIALSVVTAAGFLLSLKFYAARLSEKEIRRRKILLQTMAIWGPFATFVALMLMSYIFNRLPVSIWRF